MHRGNLSYGKYFCGSGGHLILPSHRNQNIFFLQNITQLLLQGFVPLCGRHSLVNKFKSTHSYNLTWNTNGNTALME